MCDLVKNLRTATKYGYMPRRMRELADEAADALEAAEARLKTAIEGLQIIANEDWTWANPAQMRRVAQGHLDTLKETDDGQG